MESDKPLSYLQFVTAVLGFGIALVAFRGPLDAIRIVGLALAASALVLFLVAKVQLGDSFSILPEAHTLVTRGIYSKIRHPIYFFSAFLIFGLALFAERPVFLLVFAVIIPVQILRMRREDKVLEEKFGDEYRRYRQNAWF